MDIDQLHDLGYLFACKIFMEYSVEDNLTDEDFVEPAEHFISVLESLGVENVPSIEWFINDYKENWS